MQNPKIKARITKAKTALLKNSSEGSVSMEYIIVSCFALLISITAVTWLGKMVKARINAIAERLDMDTSDLQIDLDQPFDPAHQ